MRLGFVLSSMTLSQFLTYSSEDLVIFLPNNLLSPKLFSSISQIQKLLGLTGFGDAHCLSCDDSAWNYISISTASVLLLLCLLPIYFTESRIKPSEGRGKLPFLLTPFLSSHPHRATHLTIHPSFLPSIQLSIYPSIYLFVNEVIQNIFNEHLLYLSAFSLCNKSARKPT